VVCCQLSHRLLKHLFDQQYPYALEKANYELRDEVLVGSDGKDLDSEMLFDLVDELTAIHDMEP